MPAAPEMLTPSEAAVVAGVSLRAVNRAIDEEIVPRRLVRTGRGRCLKTDACAYIRFFYHAAEKLTADERRRVIAIWAAPHAEGGRREVVDGFITVSYGPFLEETRARHDKLKRAREMVEEDPGTLGGAPVFKGTRIPVHDVAASVAAGIPADRIQSAYSNLTDEQIELAVLYAQANPMRGRPRRRAAADLQLVSERTVSRRPRT